MAATAWALLTYWSRLDLGIWHPDPEIEDPIRIQMGYNFGRVHQSLGKNTPPATAAGLSDHVWTSEEIAALLD